MTELEALRKVAEAAREIASQLLLSEMTIEDRCDADVEGGYDALIERMRPLVRALDALPAPAAEGETVGIRAICLQAIADKLARVPKPRSYEMAHYCMGLEDAALAIQSKIVPLPRVPEVTGEVEG